MLTEVYSDNCGVVSCSRGRKLVQIRWLKHCSGEPLRTVLSKALECATSYQLTAWLCDNRRLYYIEPSDQNWMLQNLFPSFDRQKQHRVALLVSNSNFDMMATIQANNDNAFDKEFSSFIEISYFFVEDDAEYWLTL